MKIVIEITTKTIQQADDALHLAMSDFKYIVSKMEKDPDTDVWYDSRTLKDGNILIEIDKEEQ